MTIPLLLLSMMLQSGNSTPPPDCAADIRWTNGSVRTVNRDVGVTVLNLLSSVSSSGRGACQSAEIRISAFYYDNEDNFMCSGTIPRVVTQGPYASVNFEIRPWNVLDFLTWKTTPPKSAVPLTCTILDGTGTLTDFSRATTLRIYATVLPQGGGVAVAEMRLTLQGGQR